MAQADAMEYDEKKNIDTLESLSDSDSLGFDENATKRLVMKIDWVLHLDPLLCSPNVEAIGLVGNIVQFVDFSGNLISKSAQLYRSSEGALVENMDIETATNDLVLLSNKLRDHAASAGDGELRRLCESCTSVARDLMVALEKVKAKGKHQKWESVRKALRSVVADPLRSSSHV